jgi:hypothetical protein
MADKKKKHPTEEQKKKLDNSKVPNVTTRKILKSIEKDDWEEADRLYDLMQAELRKERDKKKR